MDSLMGGGCSVVPGTPEPKFSHRHKASRPSVKPSVPRARPQQHTQQQQYDYISFEEDHPKKSMENAKSNRPHRAMSILQIHDAYHRTGWSGFAQNPGVDRNQNRMPTVIQFDNPHFRDDITDPKRLRQIIRDKVRGHARMDTVQKSETWKAFLRSGSKRGEGIPKDVFVKRLRQWGIRPTDRCYDAWWQSVDLDGNGTMDFNEFYHASMPQDYSHDDAPLYGIVRGFTESPNTTMNDIFLASIGQRKQIRDDEDTLFKKLDAQGPGVKQLSMAEVEEVIKNKVRERTKSDASQMAEAFKLFGCPKKGLSKANFKKKLNQWGIHIPAGMLNTIYNKFDLDNSGTLDFNEFLSFVGMDDASHPLHGNKEKKVWNQKVRSRLFAPRPPPLGTDGREAAIKKLAKTKAKARNADVQACFRRLWVVMQKSQSTEPQKVDDLSLMRDYLAGLGYTYGSSTMMPFTHFRQLLQSKLKLGARSFQMQALNHAYRAHDSTGHADNADHNYINSDAFFREALQWKQHQQPKQRASKVGKNSAQEQIAMSKAEMLAKRPSQQARIMAEARFDWSKHRQAVGKRVLPQQRGKKGTGTGGDGAGRKVRIDRPGKKGQSSVVMAWGSGYGGQPVRLPSEYVSHSAR